MQRWGRFTGLLAMGILLLLPAGSDTPAPRAAPPSPQPPPQAATVPEAFGEIHWYIP